MKTKEQKALLRKYKMIPLFWKILSEQITLSNHFKERHHRMTVVNILTGEVIAIEE